MKGKRTASMARVRQRYVDHMTMSGVVWYRCAACRYPSLATDDASDAGSGEMVKQSPGGSAGPGWVVRRAVAAVDGADPALLDGFVDGLFAASNEARRLPRHEVDRHRAVGVTAAERGIPLGVVVDLYLTATTLAWPLLPRPASPEPDGTAAVVLHAATDAVAAVTVGYEAAQRTAIRSEEAARREFIDDLLQGGVESAWLAERVSRYGLALAADYWVAVAEAEQPFVDFDERTRQLESALHHLAGVGTVLVTTKDGQLVCVMPSTRFDETDFTSRAQALTRSVRCRIGVGRPRSGLAGIAQSYRDARDAVTMAGRLDLPDPVVRARDLLVYQVLFRDRAAIAELVATVLSPLRQVRGGARSLLDTLSAYVTTGSAVAAARHLGVSVRTITYRLKRVQELTGFDAVDPVERYTLRTAVLGARLLGWPDTPLDRTEHR
jgi:hypothetical protein